VGGGGRGEGGEGGGSTGVMEEEESEPVSTATCNDFEGLAGRAPCSFDPSLTQIWFTDGSSVDGLSGYISPAGGDFLCWPVR
jgi:hypothetical protein